MPLPAPHIEIAQTGDGWSFAVLCGAECAAAGRGYKTYARAEAQGRAEIDAMLFTDRPAGIAAQLEELGL